MMKEGAAVKSTPRSLVVASDLDPELRAALRARLETARNAALRRAARVEPAPPAVEQDGPRDPDARQTIDIEHDVQSIVQHEQLHDVVEPILGAIERFDAGTYGSCVDCERPIGAARLLAIPYAARCLSCQDRREQDDR
jgi:DnaK suppressor protein